MDYNTVQNLVSEFQSFLRMKGAHNYEGQEILHLSGDGSTSKSLILKIEVKPMRNYGPCFVGSLLTPWGKRPIAWTLNPQPWETLVQNYRDPLGFTHLEHGSFPSWEDSPLSGWQCYRVTSPDVSENAPRESAVPVQ